MAKIGYAYVGELANFNKSSVEDTPDGMRFCRPPLIRELQSRRHDIYSLQYFQEKDHFPNVLYGYNPHYSAGDIPLFPNIDVLFVEWRWKTYKGDTKDLRQQRLLLDEYHGKIPIILYDASYKISESDERKYPLAIIADPGVNPKNLTRKRERLMFWSNFEKIKQVTENNSLVGHSVYGYIGNDYERRDSFMKYYVDPSRRLRNELGVQTAIYGKWLKGEVNDFTRFEEYRSIHFGGRWSYKDSMKFQSKFLSTCHIAKPEYYEHGNVTVRFFDSLATGTPGLVPKEYICNSILGKDWIVDSTNDVVKCIERLTKMTHEQRLSVVDEQQESLLKMFPDTHVKSTADFIESKIK